MVSQCISKVHFLLYYNFIIYRGRNHFVFSDVDYSGPGFSKQIVRDNPILPSKSSSLIAHLRRSASCGAVPQENGDKQNYCYCSIDYSVHLS